MFRKLILAICVPRLLNAASQSEIEHNSRLARRSSTALAELLSELIDRDSIHCLPSECFGSLTCIDQISTQTTWGMRLATSSPLASILTRREAQQTRSTDSISATDTDGLSQPHRPGQVEAVIEDNLDSAMNVVPDTAWALEDVRNCDHISRFSDLVVDEPSSGTSDTTAPSPSTLPSLDALLSPGSAKFAEESIQGSSDVTNNSLVTWENMLW